MADIVRTGKRFLSKNSRTILTSIAVFGTVATAVVASKNTLAANDLISDKVANGEEIPEGIDLVKEVAPCYIPTVLTVGATVAAIVGTHQIGTGKIVAYSGAYTMATEASRLYRDKVKEIVDKDQLKQIDDSYLKEKESKDHSKSATVLIGDGDVLCYDAFSGRYFSSTMEKIRKAQNDINFEINSEMYADLNSFYEAIGLGPIGAGDDIGWSSDNQVDLTFSSMIRNEDGKPVLAIDFKVPPSPNYRNLH